MLAICCISAFAYDFKVGSIYYNIIDAENKKVAVTYKRDTDWDYRTYTKDIEIPSQVTYEGTTYKVTAIGDYAFKWQNGLKNIKVNAGVVTIGEYAFLSCDSLESVELPNTVSYIGYAAFSECDRLRSINIPPRVKRINPLTFNQCQRLKSIVIPDSVAFIGYGAFSMCSLSNVELPARLVTIQEKAFAYNEEFDVIEIPSSVRTIGPNIFLWTSVKKFISHIPAENLNAIDEKALKWNSPLYVPYGAKETYENTDGWKNFVEIIEMEDTQSHLAQSISLDYESFTLAPENTIQLTATVLPETAKNKSVTWTSSNDEVATVSEGTVTAHAIGTAVIAATTQDGSNLSASCTITVAAPETPDAAEELVEYVLQNFPNGIDFIGGDWPGSYDLASVEALRAVYARYEAYILGENHEDPSVILQDFETAMNNLVFNTIKEGYYFIQPQRTVNGQLGLVADRNGNIGSEVYKTPETIASITAEDAKYIWYFKPVTEAEEAATFGDYTNYAFHIQNV